MRTAACGQVIKRSGKFSTQGGRRQMATRDKIRVGMCGLGSFSYTVANTIQRSKNIELVTCFDPVADRRRATSERYGCAQEESFEAMVGRGDLDGVMLISPNAFHREQTELAAAHGKHVYVEKPIANTLEDGRRMIAAWVPTTLKQADLESFMAASVPIPPHRKTPGIRPCAR